MWFCGAADFSHGFVGKMVRGSLVHYSGKILEINFVRDWEKKAIALLGTITYPLKWQVWRWFPFPKVGYVSFLKGILTTNSLFNLMSKRERKVADHQPLTTATWFQNSGLFGHSHSLNSPLVPPIWNDPKLLTIKPLLPSRDDVFSY